MMLLPFALLGLDTDNDSVFMNETVRDYCETAGIEFTRCRPYRKNDQAWVEQKNGAVVRHTIGYRRDEWRCAVPVGHVRSGNQPRTRRRLRGIGDVDKTVVNVRTPARHWASARGRLAGVAMRSCASRSEQRPS
jgi:hypothetical protein